MNDGRSFESYVKWVYDAIINMDLEQERVVVGQQVRLQGSRSRRFRQIDVFYSFERAGVPHRVAIECKDRERPIVMDEVGAFIEKLHDIGGIQGVIVSRSGFQGGASELAKTNSILALGPEEFPNLPQMIGRFLEALLPDETVLGAPFYAIMEAEGDGRVTGSYFIEPTPPPQRGMVILFPSPIQAEQYRVARCGDKYVVRGLTQRHLIMLLQMATLHGKDQPMLRFAVALQPDGETHFALFPYYISSLFRDFVRVSVSKDVYDPEAAPF